jgi:hypothetical protein
MCEILGFEAFATALRSRAAEIRLRKAGHEDVLTKAQAIIGTLDTNSRAIETVYMLLSHLLETDSIVETPIGDTSSHGVIAGHSVFHKPELSSGNEAHWTLWRIKSVGSLAMKCLRFDEEVPADVLGLTIVAKDIEELSVLYGGIVRCIKNNETVKEQPAPSRKQAYAVQGPARYTKKVMDSLLATGVVTDDEVDVAIKETKGHQVAKATFMYLAGPGRSEAIPVELQVQTKADRQQSQRGRAAHVLYKLGVGKSGGGSKRNAVRTLHAIHDRRGHLNSSALNPESFARGEAFRVKVAQSA